ncbi:urease subunit beta [Sporomusa termitida]|uniref:Urease subunit beta n=1 Tax=Sporomusa termitida TaxID=2377 RepID=A0A517DWK2_9FIRM|nr:urease subunit beta [Sporomusa termitida]QDR81734.1 Urease subunit beta [Sporomusa termitida]
MIPGELILATEDISANCNLAVLRIAVENTGDRPIQVGSHFHFFEVNRYLAFDRTRAWGMRLNIPAGTAVRFEPGESRTVALVRFSGTGPWHGANNLTAGSTDRQQCIDRAREKGFIK